MIARMSKYDLVLYAGQSSDFIEKLRGLGLVDITTTGWEPSDEDRQLLLTIDNHHKAVETLKRFLEDERFVKDEQPIADGGEAFDRYMAATQQAAALRSEIARLQKTADELRPWGDFSVDTLRKLVYIIETIKLKVSSVSEIITNNAVFLSPTRSNSSSS